MTGVVEDPGSVAFRQGRLVVLDTGVLVACGGPENPKYRALARVAERSGARFVVPERIHAELGGAPDAYGESDPVVDGALAAGWLSVADELDYSNSDVSRTMDAVRDRIAARS